MIEFFKKLGIGLAIVMGGLGLAATLVLIIDHQAWIGAVILILVFSWLIGSIIRDKPSS